MNSTFRAPIVHGAHHNPGGAGGAAQGTAPGGLANPSRDRIGDPHCPWRFGQPLRGQNSRPALPLGVWLTPKGTTFQSRTTRTRLGPNPQPLAKATRGHGMP